MEKITLTKTIKYYNKNTLYNSEITEKKQFTNINDAIEYLKNYDLKYIINKKGISAFEELEILHWADYKTIIKYFKTIDPNTLETSQSIPETRGKHEAEIL